MSLARWAVGALRLGRFRERLAVALALATLLGVPLAAEDAPGRADGEEAAPAVAPDVVSVTVTAKEIYVADRDGMRPPISLGLGERVIRTLAQGYVGAALTTDRLLLFADGQPAVEHRWRMGESRQRVILDARVAVAASNQRVLLFEQTQAQLHEVPVGTTESVDRLLAYEDIALAVTGRRLLVLAVGGGAVVEEELDMGETVSTVNRQVGLVTVTTNGRILQFRAGADEWQVLKTF